MDKLIKLLNDFVEWRHYWFVDYDRNMTWFNILLDWSATFLWEETVLSRNFWFIGWLWENWHLKRPQNIEDELKISIFLPQMPIDDEVITRYYMLLAFVEDPIDLLCKQLIKWKRKK